MSPSENKVYTFLFQHARPCTVEYIATRLKMPRSTVQKALTKLRSDGRVERELGMPGQGHLWRE